ncbi:Imidazole glycerol phosphate synthase amidotransferase subunit [Candidatus Vidania fulgoroideae]|nr:Imidazole glycerol phosphate synthase amidotransferase subunit [Candidatus Vidania fulgoroideae]
MIGLLDMGFGNIKSVKNTLNFSLPYKEEISCIKKKEDIKGCRRIVIPGHGFFKSVVDKAKKIDVIRNILKSKKKILGICIGLQMFGLFNFEGHTNGFGLFKENVEKFDYKKNFEIPNIGWRKVKVVRKNKFLKKDSDFYFAHSYFVKPCKDSYGITKGMSFFSSLIIKNNIVLTQFHPEKSGYNGIKFIKKFLE